MFTYDTTGVQESSDFKILPAGAWFTFRITKAEETVTKKTGEPMIKLRVEVVNDTEWSGTGVLHSVTFMSDKLAPGAGMSVHFMKCIGVPHEGKVDVNAPDWEGKLFRATTVIDTYNGKQYSKIKTVKPYDDGGVPF